MHISYILHFAFFAYISYFIILFAYICIFHFYVSCDIFIFHVWYFHISYFYISAHFHTFANFILDFSYFIFVIFHTWYFPYFSYFIFCMFYLLNALFLCFAQVNKTFLVTLNGVLAVCSGVVLGLLNPCQETRRRFVSYFIEFHLY